MIKNKGSRGFTLIELLVVIAIIGVLAVVIFGALGSARTKSNDAAVKSGLNQARTQADLFYATTGNYKNLCEISSDGLTPRGINFMLLSSGKANGYTLAVTANGSGTSPVRCNVSGDNIGWAAEVPLKGTAGTYYCVDYKRTGIVTTSSIGLGGGFAYCR